MTHIGRIVLLFRIAAAPAAALSGGVIAGALFAAACTDSARQTALDAGPSRPDSSAATAARSKLYAACQADFAAGLELPEAGPPVSFRDELMPFFVTHCNFGGCHIGEDSTGQLMLGEGCMFEPRTGTCVVDGGSLTTDIAQKVYANLLSPSVTAPALRRVEPGNVARSFILFKLSGCENAFEPLTGCKFCGSSMPPVTDLRQGDPNLFDRIAEWIAAGAPSG